MDDAKSEEGTLTVSGKTLDVDYTGQHMVEVTDRSGHTIPYHLFQRVHYAPVFKVKILQQIKGFNMRPDDIYFTGYPRTGTNWTFEMTSMLLNGKAETIQKAKDLIELTPHDELAQLPSPRIINSHMKLSDSPTDVTSLKCKVIFTMRDPKDVAVSLYKLYYNRTFSSGTYNGDFEDFLQLFMDGTEQNRSPLGSFPADQFHPRSPEKRPSGHIIFPQPWRLYNTSLVWEEFPTKLSGIDCVKWGFN